jgi:hypothetical protein
MIITGLQKGNFNSSKNRVLMPYSPNSASLGAALKAAAV